MKTLLAPWLMSASGSIGPVTAANNRNQPYLKEKQTRAKKPKGWTPPAMPCYPPCGGARVKNNIKLISFAWKNLTENQRIAWNNLAASMYDNGATFRRDHVKGLSSFSGRAKITTGFGLFQFSNLNLNYYEEYFISNPPTDLNFPAAITPSLDVNTTLNTMELTIIGGVIPVDHSLIIYWTRPMSAGNQIRRNKLKWYRLYHNGVAPVTDIGADYELFNDWPPLGSKVGLSFQVMNMNNGFKSDWVTCSAIAY